jgi:predicted metalloprotease with PDZ domain
MPPTAGSHPRILRVEEQSPAWHAGIDPGDLIVAVDGQETRILHAVSFDLALSADA